MGLLDKWFGKGGGGDPPALANEITKAFNGLQAVTAAHDATWKLGSAAWSVDQDTGIITFKSPGLTAHAPVQIIGTYNTLDSTWLWGWNHPSVAEPLSRDARRLLVYGQAHKYGRLTTQKLQCSEQQCWELTALAFLLCKANGAYRGPAGSTLIFMTFGEVSLSKPR